MKAPPLHLLCVSKHEELSEAALRGWDCWWRVAGETVLSEQGRPWPTPLFDGTYGTQETTW